jgi:hypothetical protein
MVHEIQIPSTEPHNLYYSGHHRYHCIHTQVSIDNQLNIRHIESGFLGHNNDAQTFRMMTNIGDGEILDLTRNCVLIGDCIYPSRHPLVTPYTSEQILQQPNHIRPQYRRLNRELRRRRVYVTRVLFSLSRTFCTCIRA